MERHSAQFSFRPRESGGKENLCGIRFGFYWIEQEIGFRIENDFLRKIIFVRNDAPF